MLARAGIPSELITIANGPHGFDDDMANPLVQRALASVLGFLQKHLA
ncbi:MAG: hypothetical protein ACUVWR_06650 [Anaerolineae bacterium]